jgi:hypothetical protein
MAASPKDPLSYGEYVRSRVLRGKWFPQTVLEKLGVRKRGC